MAVVIPVSVSSAPSAPPLSGLVAELFWVSADGRIASDLGGAPVIDGVATIDVPPRPQGLRWAIRIRDDPTGSAAYRSGPLGRLPSGGRGPMSGGTIRIHRGGGVVGLDSLDGAESLLRERVRAMLPRPLRFAALELGSDAEGRYVLTLSGRMELAGMRLAFEYRRAFRVAGALDPGRPARAAVAWPEGPARGADGPLRRFAGALDAVLAAAIEAQLGASAIHLAHLMCFADGVGFAPATASLTRLEIFPPDTFPGVDAKITLCAGAIVGAFVVPEHPIVVG
jgi:hypothetical protein